MIHKKMIEVLNEVGHIAKEKSGTLNYKFRGIDDMYNALHGLFGKHGLFLTSEIVSGTREERKTQKGGTLIYSIIDVKFTFYAEDGTNVSSIMRGEAMDTSDKASNKAMSVALKYALMQAFLIPTEEQIDTEYNNHEPKPIEPPEKPSNYILACDALKKESTLDGIDKVYNRILTREWSDKEKEALSLLYNRLKIKIVEAEFGAK